MWSVYLLIPLTLLAGVAGWMFFLWAVKSGQFEDPEGPKYRMLEDDPPEGDHIESDTAKDTKASDSADKKT